MSRNGDIGTFKVPVGATRPAVISGLNITYIWLLPVFGLPIVVMLFTGGNIFWGGGTGLLMLYVARQANSDGGLPRIMWLWLVSGSLTASKDPVRGVEVTSAARPLGDGEAVTHG